MREASHNPTPPPPGAARRWLLPAVLILAMALAMAAAPAAADQAPGAAEGGPHPRIISFSPAVTQMLLDMGLGENIVGVTRFCRLPAGMQRPIIGDAYAADTDAILKTAPDLILSQTETTKFDGVRAVRRDVCVLYLKIETLGDIWRAIETIGAEAGRSDEARQYSAGLQAQVAYVRQKVANLPRPRVLFVMGTDRPTAFGANNFIADLIEAAGGVNAGASIASGPWIATDLDAIRKVQPEVIFCQGTFGQEAADLLYWQTNAADTPAVRHGRVYPVSHPRWSIPSTHAPQLAMELARDIHPEAFDKAPAPAPPAGEGMPAWLVTLFRLIAAAVVGAALAVAGSALQGLLRNPLAEPYVLGVSSGAGVGVLAGLALTGWAEAALGVARAGRVLPGWLSTPVLAFAGAMATCTVVYLLAQRRGRLDPYSLVLSGVIINTFNGAVMLVIQLHLSPYRIADFSRWAMGWLPDAVGVPLLVTCSAFVAVGAAVLVFNAKAFNVLGLGDEVAASSGVRVHALRLGTFLAVGLMTAAAVALAGPIGFLGLIIPHITRLIAGPEHRRLIVLSGLLGAAFLVGAEVLCRKVGAYFGVGLIPVGIVTALCGGPFFIFLLRRRYREQKR